MFKKNLSKLRYLMRALIESVFSRETTRFLKSILSEFHNPFNTYKEMSM